MIHTLTRNFEKLTFALAAVALGLSGAWYGRNHSAVRDVRAMPVTAVVTGAAYPAQKWQAPDSGIAVWPKAPTQSGGDGWLYEVFTPPVIYYNATARSFTVSAPQYPGEAGPMIFGLELLAVKREPYRLQLAGYFGSPGDYLVAFVSSQMRETLLAREGRRFDQLGLTLKSFAVRKLELASDEAQPVYDIAAQAVLQDETTGAEVVLDSRTPKLTDTPIAVFKLPGKSGMPGELHEGDTLTDDEATYRIERIQLDPPEVVVARMTPGLPVPETRLLRPTGQFASKSGKNRPAAESSAQSVATTGH